MPRTKTSNKTTTRTKRKKAESPKPAAKQRAPRRARNTRQQAAAAAQAEQTERPPRSDKPERILTFLRKFMGENGYPPSVRDVVDGCKLSSTSVADYNLRILERQGHIRRDPERARTIVLTEPLEPAGGVAAVEPLRVPLLGRDRRGHAGRGARRERRQARRRAPAGHAGHARRAGSVDAVRRHGARRLDDRRADPPTATP